MSHQKNSSSNSWTIGSDSSCDLVVEGASVSARHCILTLEDGKYQVEDLGSTNGTWVNGSRIERTRAIAVSDRITLGQSVLMPWPPSSPESKEMSTVKHAGQSKIISIGRTSEQDVILDSPNISSSHARLIVATDGILLEDLGSTNGTALHRVENKILRAKVQPEDLVFFGSVSYRVSDLLEKGGLNASEFVLRTNDNNTAKLLRNGTIALAALVVLVLAATIGLMSGTRTDDIAEERRGDGQHPAADATRNDGHTSGPSQPSDPVLSTQSPPLEDGQTIDERDLDDLADPMAGIFLVVCSDSEYKTQFRVGTAFAIDANHLATSASVISMLNDLMANGYPEAFVYSPMTRRRIDIASTIVHPQYEAANRTAKEAQQRYDGILDALETSPPEAAQLEQQKQHLLAARMTAFQSMEKQTTFDAAVIQVTETIESHLPVTQSLVALRPNMKLLVKGFAFDMEDPYFDSNASFDLLAMEIRIHRLLGNQGDSTERLLAGGDSASQQSEFAFFGSPVFNQSGQVVAVYSRATPPETDGEPIQRSLTFDAALFDRVRECMESLQ